MKLPNPARRRIVAGSAAALALGPLCARAQAFPSKNMRVVVPTGQGGGADRLARVFDDFWGPLLKTNFEYGFFSGAAGQVGYELYLHKRERDGHNLLFGNMGPEMIMYALQKPKYRFPEDYQYFCRLDVDDSVVYVRRQSPFKRLEDLVRARATDPARDVVEAIREEVEAFTGDLHLDDDLTLVVARLV